MNIHRIIPQLKHQYPGKEIIYNPPDNPTEIICEIEPTSEHPERSVAIAVAGKSKPHFHKKSTEVYEIVRGTLFLFKDGEKHILYEGERMTIIPGTIHSAEGDECWFLTYSKPGWTAGDHIIVNS